MYVTNINKVQKAKKITRRGVSNTPNIGYAQKLYA